MSNNKQVETLVRTLNYHRVVIEKLLTHPAAANVRSNAVSILERKIVNLEQLILNLPDDGETQHSELFVSWRDTMIELWSRFFTVLDGNSGDVVTTSNNGIVSSSPANTVAAKVSPRGTQISVTNVEASSSVSNTNNRRANYGKKRNGGPKKPVQQPNPEDPDHTDQSQQQQQQVNQQSKRGGHISRPYYRYRDFKPSGRNESNQPAALDDANQQVDELEIKENLRLQIEASFLALSQVEQLSDLEEMQTLITLVDNSAKELESFKSDFEFQNEMLGFALPKLPVVLMELFNALSDGEKSLSLLTQFLGNQLAAYSNDLKETLKVTSEAVALSTAGGDEPAQEQVVLPIQDETAVSGTENEQIKSSPKKVNGAKSRGKN